MVTWVMEPAARECVTRRRAGLEGLGGERRLNRLGASERERESERARERERERERETKRD